MWYLYILVSTLWFSIFYAFMQKHKERKNEYWDYGAWKGRYMVLLVFGIFFWWIAIFIVIFVKLANKYLFNK
jgi:hypothetical protein